MLVAVIAQAIVGGLDVGDVAAAKDEAIGLRL